MQYLMGIDLGTSGVKSVLFTDTGSVVAESTREYPMHQPHNGWAEQDPADWWNATVASITDLFMLGDIDMNEVRGIGLSGQMHGLVMLDAGGEVLRPAILWCDQRTGKECEELTEKMGARRLIEITANPAITGFTASKILWVKNNEPELYHRCAHILLPKDYIRFRLTGQFATDVSDASGMQLLDVPNRCWSEEVLEKLGIDPKLLPRVYESPEITGYLSPEASHCTGLSTSIPVVGGAGDNAAAAVGCGVVQEGRAFTTIGTSGVVYAHTDKLHIDPKGRVHTFCCAVPGCWHVMGVTQAAGLSLKWFRDQFCAAEMETARLLRIDPYAVIDQQAQNIPIGAEKLLFLPYLMGERSPHLDPDCRGVFFGLSAIHQKSHLIRAVLEGVSYSLRDCVEVLREMSVTSTEMTLCGGGAKSTIWRQMLADLYGCTIRAASSQQGAAMGAAILAGVGSGVFHSVQQGCEKMLRTGGAYEPVAENSAEYEKYYRVYRGLYPQLRQSFHALAQLD